MTNDVVKCIVFSGSLTTKNKTKVYLCPIIKCQLKNHRNGYNEINSYDSLIDI